VPGRFPLFTDENVDGPLIKGLIARGWDVVRAIDVFGERADDATLFAYAAEQGRVFVTGDRPSEAIAIRWLREARRFHGMIRCQAGTRSVGDLVAAFEKLAEGGGSLRRVSDRLPELNRGHAPRAVRARGVRLLRG
jgi:hypothetical protein